MESLWSGSIGDWSEAGAQPRPDEVPANGSGWSQAGPKLRPDEVPPATGGIEPLPVEVVRSAKRRKTISARIVDGRIVVRVPARLSRAEEAEAVASLVARLERQRSAEAVDLPDRARALARRYDLPEPESIRFVSNQAQRWGSCTPSTGEIRISDRVGGFPPWVLDAVIVHELAHLVHLHHTPEFWQVANRYPKAERAYGFLLAMQMVDER